MSSPDSHGLPQYLVDYILKRDQQYMQDVNDFLASLTQRERLLLKDIAVMGYVQGMRRPKNEKIPTDGAIVCTVVHACFAFSDKYPAVRGQRAEMNCRHGDEYHGPETGCTECPCWRTQGHGEE